MTTRTHRIEYTGMRSGSRARPDGVVYIGGIVRTNPVGKDPGEIERLAQQERRRVLEEIGMVTGDQGWLADCEPAADVPIEIIQVIDAFSEERITMWRLPIEAAGGVGEGTWHRDTERGLVQRLRGVLR